MSAHHHLESFADVLRATDRSLVPPATLTEARQRRDALAGLLGREREAAADFLLALSDFDRRRGWERLGHASLFAFLTRELGLSKGAAYLRFTAARLLPRHSAVESALRSGRLCLSVVGELSRVLTPENEAEVLPRFLGRSAREAREVVAELSPCPEPPTRTVVTAVARSPGLAASQSQSQSQSRLQSEAQTAAPAGPSMRLPTLALVAPSAPRDAAGASAAPLVPHGADLVRTSEPDQAHSPRPASSAVEPLTGDLRRLHVTVSRRFLEKLAAARDGLAHARPGATTEQILDVALDLLLEKQARAKALVKRPRREKAAAATAPAALPTATVSTPAAHPEPFDSAQDKLCTPSAVEGSESSGTSTLTPTSSEIAPATPESSGDDDARRAIPAHVEREVRLRDGGRCQFPLDAGGVCGSTWQVQLDHLVPRALGGPATAANLRCACAFHNRYAAGLALGPAVAAIRRRK